ncbi:hypothetical protein ABNG03_10765 [Halorubrum sp. RMP-47]|uniref:Uncharacterized protein n=1 Tax=Halorubrum miltondacostae TaxID=3076378 RepID=A0ABD5M429_9EURY
MGIGGFLNLKPGTDADDAQLVDDGLDPSISQKSSHGSAESDDGMA